MREIVGIWAVFRRNGSLYQRRPEVWPPYNAPLNNFANPVGRDAHIPPAAGSQDNDRLTASLQRVTINTSLRRLHNNLWQPVFPQQVMKTMKQLSAKRYEFAVWFLILRIEPQGQRVATPVFALARNDRLLSPGSIDPTAMVIYRCAFPHPPLTRSPFPQGKALALPRQSI